jgi:hypothetical protein
MIQVALNTKPQPSPFHCESSNHLQDTDVIVPTASKLSLFVRGLHKMFVSRAMPQIG